MNINQIGNKLVSCRLDCDGVNNNPERGIIPRCLLIEKQEGRNKCVVIGLNPGKSSKKEQKYYLKNRMTYDAVKNFFLETELRNRAYFKRTRELLSFLNFNGDILWTDLVKCECLGKNGNLPVQTLRTCINNYLKKEIEAFQAKTIFALGHVAYNFCSLSLPSHFIVGLPHPTGSYGHFDRLNQAIRKNPRSYITRISQRKDKNGKLIAIYLRE